MPKISRRPARGRIAFILASSCSTALIAPASGWAQAVPAENATQGGVEDIVVTARKRSESVQDIPVSITALSAQAIERGDLTSLEKISARTPQFQVGRAQSGSGAQLTLRGIGSTATSIGVEQSVAVIVDDVYYGQGRIINEAFFDLARVELLKGPQALFYGKNATAGVISIATANPGPDREWIFRAGYEFRAERPYGEIILSEPLTDSLGLRVAVRASKMYGGYYKNRGTPQTISFFDIATGSIDSGMAPVGPSKVPEERELVGRVTLRWEPDDRLTATLKVSGNDTKSYPGWNFAPYSCAGPNTDANPANPCKPQFTVYQNQWPEMMVNSGYPHIRSGRQYSDYKSWGVTGTIDYELDKVSLSFVNNYNWNKNSYSVKGDYSNTTVPTASSYVTERTPFKSFSSELRGFTQFDSPVNLLFGVYYQKTRRDYHQWVSTGGVQDSTAGVNRFVAVEKDSSTRGETISPYGQLIWKIISTLEATAGVRYTHETKKSTFVQPYVNAALQGNFPQDAVARANQKFTNWSPDATLTWKPERNITIYGAYKTAYKSGGFSNSGFYSALTPDPLADFTFEPEKAKGFEAGIKTTLMDNQLRLNFGVYRYKYSNLQVDFFNFALFTYQTINAGATKTKGFELDFEFAPRSIDGLELHGSLNYNKARFSNFLAPCWSGQTPAEGCTLIGVGGAPFQDLSGAPTSVAPKWTASLGASYSAPLGGNLVLELAADSRYSSAYLPSQFGELTAKQPKFATIDASISVHTDDRKWEFSLIGKNLTNKFYVTGQVGAASTGGGTGTPAGRQNDLMGFGSLPRTVHAQVTFRY